MKVKYGILTYPSLLFFPKEGFSSDLALNHSLIVEPINKTLARSEGKHWEEWIGSIAWENFSRGKVQVQVWCESKNPDVVDNENKEIQNDLHIYAEALTLCDLLLPPADKPMIVTGLGTIENGKLVPQDIRTFGRGLRWLKPTYVNLPGYSDSEKWKAISQNGREYGTELYKQWAEIQQQLKILRNKFKEYLLFNLAFHSFLTSLGERFLDFSFPNLVRTIETLVTLSVGQGRSTFARRAMLFMPETSNLIFQFDEKALKEIIKTSYGLRSDCIHGKPFGWGLGSKQEAFQNEHADHHVYIIENLARNLIRTTLRDRQFLETTKDRSVLEKYWNERDPQEITKCPTCGLYKTA